MYIFGDQEPDRKGVEVTRDFLVTYYRGLIIILVPLVILPIAVPDNERHLWAAYTLLVMSCLWVTECIPLAVTSFLPVIIFPLTNIMGTAQTCKCYMNNTVMMFLGSLLLAAAVEQSGLHTRMAYCVIRFIGYSHIKLLGALCIVTTFVSMWITNTAATTMMVPINFAILQVFQDYKIIQIYDYNDGEKVASDVTTCYFCATTYSATIGGVGTLVGTATNLAFKGLFEKMYPDVPEMLSFIKFSAFTIPLMIVLEFFMFLSLIIQYMGVFRPKSKDAQVRYITPKAKLAAKKAIDANWKKLGGLTFWEVMVLFLFVSAMGLFFTRSPSIFDGWGDLISKNFEIKNADEKINKKFVQDSAAAFVVIFAMLLFPQSLGLFKNFTAKYQEALPQGPIPSVLMWKPVNATLAWSFMLLMGGGFTLSKAVSVTGLNQIIGQGLKKLENVHELVTLLVLVSIVIIVTNFASNVAVANVFCPIAMSLAQEIGKNPMWFNLAAGISASFCFMVPVGTPGNLVVQSAANIPTIKMVIAGIVPTFTAIIFTWLFAYLYAPVIWPELKNPLKT